MSVFQSVCKSWNVWWLQSTERIVRSSVLQTAWADKLKPEESNRIKAFVNMAPWSQTDNGHICCKKRSTSGLMRKAINIQLGFKHFAWKLLNLVATCNNLLDLFHLLPFNSIDRPFIKWVLVPYVLNICILPSIESDLEWKLQSHKQPDFPSPTYRWPTAAATWCPERPTA